MAQIIVRDDKGCNQFKQFVKHDKGIPFIGSLIDLNFDQFRVIDVMYIYETTDDPSIHDILIFVNKA